MKKPLIKVQTSENLHSNKSNSRRNFLKMGGLAVAGSSLLLVGCSDDDDDPMTPEPGDVFDLGSGDVGILNYAYALEQLEAAFYTNVLNGSYWMGLSDGKEKTILEDLYNHEVIHREFFKTAINAATSASNVLPELEFDFTGVDFSSRDTVLATAKILEDTGVAAYNGAGQLLASTDYLLIAGKIVSVEARHASAIANLINPGSTDFAGDSVLVDIGGSGVAYDKASSPSEIITAVGATGFIKTKFTANNLPTS
ncbi:ferritin-like domain-containing protein [Gillisia sp. Hel_I_29]|uniref:ferritin-like domain-containing protein n=1 Tax=Gillisia sp. Hel_I_29 TaxID=1249975 RepID=UPI000691BB7E|nr:ferritin-like domain-containing protein [Gillisia sp. Hel_I_29]